MVRALPARLVATRPRRFVLALAVLSALAAVVLHEAVFVHGSVDNDEVVYLLQGRLIASGHLLLQTPGPTQGFQPWFFALGPHGLVPKYWPTVGGLLGGSLALTGSVVPVLAIDAALLPLLMFAFCRGFLSEWRSAGAAAALALSPLVLVQSALALSYIPFVVMMLGQWWSLRVLVVRPSARLAGLSGGLFVLAFATRPLDALLLTVPAAAHALRRLARARRLRRPGLGALLSLAPGVGLLAGYDTYATGSALRAPFSALESADTLGFGPRRLFPTDAVHVFGWQQSLAGFGAHFLLAPLTWYAAGALVLPAALLAVRRWRSLAPELRWLAACGAAFAVGYLCFWGPWNASVLWTGTRALGPFYALAVLVPLIALAASVQVRRLRALAAVGVGLAVVASGVQLGSGVALAAKQDAVTTELLAAATRAQEGAQQVLVGSSDPYLGHPVSALLNPVADDDALAVAGLTPAAPEGDRRVLLQIPANPYAGPVAVDVVRQRRVAGPRLTLDVGYPGPRRYGTLVLVVAVGPFWTGCAVGPHGATTVELSARALPRCLAPARAVYRLHPSVVDPCAGRCLRLNLLSYGPHRPMTVFASRRLAIDTHGGVIATLVDGQVLLAHGGGWLSVTSPG